MPSNILFIQADQLSILGLGAYSNAPAITPNIDRLIARGTLFDNAYCNFPLCAPSRFSMASGLLASRIGAFDNGAEFPAGIPTYAHYLRLSGYRTILSGKMHFVGPDQLHGFEERLTGDIYPGDFQWAADWDATSHQDVTDNRLLDMSGPTVWSPQLAFDDAVQFRAIRRLQELAKFPDDRPFFMQVSFTHPHDPYLCRQMYWDLYDGIGIPDPDVPPIPEEDCDPQSLALRKAHGFIGTEGKADAVRRARRAYYGAVSYLDDLIGRLVATLVETGTIEHTAIILTSDHGDMLGERGMWLKKLFFEPAARVPLIISLPAGKSSGRSAAPVSLLDILPTFLDLSGGSVDTAEELPGQSLASIARGDATLSSDRDLLGELTCEGNPTPIVMIKRNGLKYIHSPAYPPLLFDLIRDPHELENRVRDPDYKSSSEDLAHAVADNWNLKALETEVRQSQRRRRIVHSANNTGAATPPWEHRPEPDDRHVFRGQSTYNEWAFDHLPPRWPDS